MPAESRLAYELHPMELGTKRQKEPWFLALNPYGRIPVIVDRDLDPPIVLFESGAILLYLAEKSGRLLSSAAASRAAALKWLFFGTSSIGPTAMQVHWLVRRRDKGEPHANLEIYRAELETLYGIADRRLAEAPYLAGDYSIADIAAYPWVYRHAMQGIAMARFPALAAWMARVAARPAVQRGMNIPPRSDGL
jgi:GSH-dependent disulfide-bond oxidoreductase